MSVLRIEALQQLSECISNVAPELRGKICAGPASPGKKLGFPSLAIIPVKFTYHPDQADVHLPLASGAVLNVGRHEGIVQLRLGAQNHRARATLEQKILDIFLSRPGSPGVLVTVVPQCHDATVAWELDTDEWENERAFDQKWYSIMTVLCQLPALVTRGSVPTIEEIRLTLTDDLTTDITDVPSTEQETIQVNLDGTIETADGPS